MPSASHLRLVALATFLVGATAPAMSAQRLNFEPRISALWRYTSNVNVVGTGDESPSSSDSALNAVVLLPLNRPTRFGSWGVNYSGSYYRYQTNTQFDNLAHNLNFNLAFDFRRRAKLTVDGYYTLTQDQAIPDTIEGEDQFLTVRTKRNYYGLRTRFTKDVRRWYWQLSAAGAKSEFERIDDSLPPSPSGDIILIPEDRTRLIGYAEFRRKFTSRFSLGGRYDVARSELGRTGNELYQVYSVSIGWSTKRFLAIDGSVGVFRSDFQGNSTLDIESQTETGFAWTMRLRVRPPLAAIQQGKIQLGTDLGTAPRGGGSLAGTSIDTFARVYLQRGRSRSPWFWSTGIRYTRRESTIEGAPTLQTGGLEAAVEYRLGDLLSVRLGLGWAKQLDQATDSTDASFTNTQLGLVLHPKGRRR